MNAVRHLWIAREDDQAYLQQLDSMRYACRSVIHESESTMSHGILVAT